MMGAGDRIGHLLHNHVLYALADNLLHSLLHFPSTRGGFQIRKGCFVVKSEEIYRAR